MKKALSTILISFTLLYSCSTPIDQSKQRTLIEQNEIKVGMSCQNLTEALGGYLAITYLYLEEKLTAKSLLNSYLLLSTYSEDSNKFFYLCERKRDKYINVVSSMKKHVYDYDLVEIFVKPIPMIRYVLYISSEDTSSHILSEVNLLDYNLTYSQVEKALLDIEKIEDEEFKNKLEIDEKIFKYRLEKEMKKQE